MADGKVPVQESVGAALRFVRENIAQIAIVSALGAATLTVLTVLSPSNQNPLIGMVLGLATTFVTAFIYAAFTGAALNGAGGMAQRIFADGGRVWAAMAIVGFFLFIVFIVLMIPGFIVLAVMLGGKYATELQGASGDEAASLALFERIGAENPLTLTLFALFYGLLWLALTSRLYLSAPASVDNKRILTFETWAWTKNNMLRIIGARVMLLLPAYILMSALAYMLGRAIGMDMMNPASMVAFAQSNVAFYAVFTFVAAFLQIALYRSLEAGLSAYLYRGLKPAVVAPSS